MSKNIGKLVTTRIAMSTQPMRLTHFMQYHRPFIVALCFVYLYLCTSSICMAQSQEHRTQELQLNGFLLDTKGNTLILRLDLGVSDFKLLEYELREGAVVTLESKVTLRPDAFFSQKTLADPQRQITLRMDPLTREFILTDDRTVPNKNKSLKQLLASALSDMVVPLCALDALAYGKDYILTLDVSLRYADISPWLAKTLFFLPWNMAPPLTYSMTFTF